MNPLLDKIALYETFWFLVLISIDSHPRAYLKMLDIADEYFQLNWWKSVLLGELSKLTVINCLTQVGLNIFQEYGITRDEKLGVAHSVCARLLRNIKGDLRHADSSDIHTRLNPE